MVQAKKVIGYVRVSTEKQADTGVSLEAQEAKIRQYAVLYDLELVRIEVDSASAKDLERPALQRVLNDLSVGEADGILVCKLDRLTRSVRDLATLLERQAAEDWAIMSVQDSLDTTTAAGRLVLNVLMSVAQWEREAISERTQAAIDHMRSQGLYVGGKVPYGWERVDQRLVEVPHEQEGIKYAKRLRAQGLSLRQIGASMAKRGYDFHGGPWSAKSIQRIVEPDKEPS